MKDEVLVKVEGVSKKFCRDLKRSLWYGVKDISSELFGAKKNGQLRPKEFWAVDDVSFELRRGECLGLIGHNGAGKSTLLKMLNGLIKPDKGTITMQGRIGALIELGSGFNPILTGRENIYNNGSVLGFSRKEIDAKFDSIVEFAELSEFIDTPVQNYSSGMKVRLGFAVAAQMEPDVLLIDEVLAVGDIGFSFKCFNRIFEMSNDCVTILVSHDMSKITRVATSTILMKSGIVASEDADVNMGVEKYFSHFDMSENTKNFNSRINLNSISINGRVFDKKLDAPRINYLDDLFIGLDFTISTEIQKYTINVAIRDMGQRLVAQSFMADNENSYFENDGASTKVEIKLPKTQFSLGVFNIDINFREYVPKDLVPKKSYFGNFRNIASFRAFNNAGFSNAPIKLISEYKQVK
jgi:lipopolysaccharide transport system ATP-binding protein